MAMRPFGNDMGPTGVPDPERKRPFIFRRGTAAPGVNTGPVGRPRDYGMVREQLARLVRPPVPAGGPGMGAVAAGAAGALGGGPTTRPRELMGAASEAVGPMAGSATTDQGLASPMVAGPALGGVKDAAANLAPYLAGRRPPEPGPMPTDPFQAAGGAASVFEEEAKKRQFGTETPPQPMY